MSQNTLAFYSMTKKEFVQVPPSRVGKFRILKADGSTRYGLRCTFDDGTNASKFITKETWEALDLKLLYEREGL